MGSNDRKIPWVIVNPRTLSIGPETFALWDSQFSPTILLDSPLPESYKDIGPLRGFGPETLLP